MAAVKKLCKVRQLVHSSIGFAKAAQELHIKLQCPAINITKDLSYLKYWITFDDDSLASQSDAECLQLDANFQQSDTDFQHEDTDPQQTATDTATDISNLATVAVVTVVTVIAVDKGTQTDGVGQTVGRMKVQHDISEDRPRQSESNVTSTRLEQEIEKEREVYKRQLADQKKKYKLLDENHGALAFQVADIEQQLESMTEKLKQSQKKEKHAQHCLEMLGEITSALIKRVEPTDLPYNNYTVDAIIAAIERVPPRTTVSTDFSSYYFYTNDDPDH